MKVYVQDRRAQRVSVNKWIRSYRTGGSPKVSVFVISCYLATSTAGQACRSSSLTTTILPLLSTCPTSMPTSMAVSLTFHFAFFLLLTEKNRPVWR